MVDKEIGLIVATQREENRQAALRRAARLSDARSEARRLAACFVERDPSTRSVILFGSVATGAVRTESFDIDLAVDADRYLELLVVAEDSPFRVDLLDLRSLPAESRENVVRSGVVLHGSHP
jgi:predicted nucleotidyltransferase